MLLQWFDRDTQRHSGQLFSAIRSDLTLTDGVSVDALCVFKSECIKSV